MTPEDQPLHCWEVRDCPEPLRNNCPAFLEGTNCFVACIGSKSPCGRQAGNCNPVEYSPRNDLDGVEVHKPGCMTCEFFVMWARTNS